MRADIVVDASVLAKFFFHEEGSERARSRLTSGLVIAAPALILIEIASVAAKKIRLKAEGFERAREAVASISDLVDELVPLGGLASGAFLMAANGGFSAYDATYLALAESLTIPVLTADDRLLRSASAAGMGNLVRRL
jgi:predicted nucleic acid-binding protein